MAGNSIADICGAFQRAQMGGVDVLHGPSGHRGRDQFKGLWRRGDISVAGQREDRRSQPGQAVDHVKAP